MVDVKIENLTFPSEVVERIEIARHDNTISIQLSDPHIGKYHKQFQKWINLSGTYDTKIVEGVSIGKHHFEEKFTMSCKPSPGIAGKITDHLIIILAKVPENGL